MLAYIVRRLLLMIPTLFGIMVINFLIIQAAPGGPVEQMIAKIRGTSIAATERVSGSGNDLLSARQQSADKGQTGGGVYRGSQGLDPQFIKQLERMYGFDKPLPERFVMMMGNFLRFDFGNSYTSGRPVVDLIIEKLPVSISLGLWTTLLTYLVCIPLGVAKAVRDGTPFDIWTSMVVIGLSAIPGFMFAILLIVLFAGGTVFHWFPLRGITSENWDGLSFFGKILDYFWHMTLPLIAMTIGSFAALTMLTKNSFLEQINQQYVTTARAKGLTERRVLYGHVFRNAMLIVISGIPATLIGIIFTGAMLIEIIFSLDGLGLLGYEAVINRDYQVVFATTYAFGLLGLLIGLIGDLTYMLVDPRIDFEARST
ncbi:microcin C ABC transporter permease YejB [Dongia sedimenti]|uniref:Microcin C ABC transporter permease YejB n=1 Tax=Dongia sedimenti TaxID=3064282 RepID=A0ABU0YR53_9PROT|nr:microcin C ABC transporter permease YejB [Rhodospirillaceae bacterium R-7]